MGALLVGLLFQGNLKAQNAVGPRAVPKGVSVPEVWQADQHLYVKGDLGVPLIRLAELEAWLDSNAPHWTVFLARDAVGERFVDALGQTFQGMDAVEEAMGTRLPNQTAFGELRHPETRQRSGAYLIIFLQERKFSYHASEVHDARGLGESSWVGKLDQPAFRAMRSGGRLLDAVKDTILNVDGLLARRIEAEKSEAKLRQEKALRSIEAAEDLFSYAREEDAGFRERHPKGTSLGEAGWEEIRETLSTARAQFELGEHEKALSGSEKVRTTLKKWLEDFDEFKSMELQLNETRAILAENPPHRGSEEARQTYEEAAAELERAETALSGGDFEAQRLVRSAAARLEKLRLQNQETELRVARTRTGLAGGAAGATALGSALLFFLNRRRRPVRDEALSTLQEWQAGFAQRRDRIFDLLDRCRANIGTRADLEESRTSGTTRTLSEEALRDVDELFVMSASVDRLVDEAAELSRPSGIVPRIRNFIAKKPFHRTLDLLREKPVQFTPEEGLEMILRREDGQTYGPVIDDPENREPFTMTFEELVEAFDKKALEAEEEINRIEAGWAEILPALRGVEERLEKLGEKSSDLADRASDDGYLALPSLSESELPRIGEALEKAGDRGETDPVAALEEDLPALQRQSEEASDLTELLLDYRNETYPVVEQQGRRLVANGRRADWVADHLARVSENADQLLTGLGERSVSEEITEVESGLNELASKTARAVEIDEAARGSLRDRIAVVRADLEVARNEIGKSLGLPSEKILDGEGVEPGEFNPDHWLLRAQGLFPALEASLDEGSVAGADALLGEITEYTEEASDLISDARLAFSENPDRLAEAKRRQKRLEEDLEKHGAILDHLRKTYASDALRVVLADPRHLDPSETILPFALEAAKSIDHVADLLPATDGIHGDGQLFHAASLLDSIQMDHEQIRLWFSQIEEQAKGLAEAEKQNALDVEELTRLLDAAILMTRDHRVSAANCSDSERIIGEAGELDRILEAGEGRAHPFEAAEKIADLRASLQNFEARVQADYRAHGAAKATIRDTSAQISAAERLSSESHQDQIPDSPEISTAVRKIQSLRREHELHEARLEQERGDWNQLDEESHDLLEEASRLAATMRSELAKARSCIDSIHAAAAEVRRARQSAGIIGGMFHSPGASTLHMAHEQLKLGDYPGATRIARQALVEASSAIQRARAAAARKRREAEAAERRRRRQQRQGAFSSGTNGGIRNSSRSSGSIGSTRSRSRSSGSGGTFGSRSRSNTVRRSSSGTARSGW